MTIIAYTYEADHHCARCAFERFGDMLDRDDAIDGEGNPVHPLFSIDEWYADLIEHGDTIPTATLSCGTCGEIIDTVELDVLHHLGN